MLSPIGKLVLGKEDSYVVRLDIVHGGAWRSEGACMVCGIQECVFEADASPVVCVLVPSNRDQSYFFDQTKPA